MIGHFWFLIMDSNSKILYAMVVMIWQCLNSQSNQSFSVFCFSIYEIFDSQYSVDIYKFAKLEIETTMKNPEMLKFVPDHFKTRKMCKHPVKKLPDLLRYVRDLYKTQQMCHKAILEKLKNQTK